jgi:hypothetical protein
MNIDANGRIRLELRTGKQVHDDIALLNKALGEKNRGGEAIGELFKV